MSAAFAARWRARIAGSSLMARLLLAQMSVLCVLWLLCMVFIVYDASKDKVTLQQQELYDAAFAVAEGLQGDPARLAHTMNAMEAALRGIGGADGVAFPGPGMVLADANGTLYRSRLLPTAFPLIAPGEVVQLESGGRQWRARTVQSPRSGLRVTIVMPADGVNIFLTMASRGTLVLPLLISLPFLILPAWFSIRVAQGPWRDAMAELATRGPQDLRPLPVEGRPRELAAMFTRINALLARVSDSAQRERAFIADAAHELRTPLAAMRINVEALQRQASEPRQQQLLDGIVSGNVRATRLVSQLLRLMRSDATVGEQLEPICFDALVQERMAALAGIADARGIELELSGDNGVLLAGRRESLVSLVDNLLDNAIKYSPQGGKVLADVRAEGAQCVLRIADQGPGIAPGLRERVFDRFFRDPRQAQGGSGLGLAIVRAVVEQHGGGIGLDAAGSMGLCVTVSLPSAAGAKR
ncbi:sensor histidine kinase [Pseudoduganella guangdongensis]